MHRHAPDNIDQRIQQDAQDFIASTIELCEAWSTRSLPRWNLPLVLWGLAGHSDRFFDIPHGIVWFVYMFSDFGDLYRYVDRQPFNSLQL